MNNIKSFYDHHSYPYEEFEAAALNDANRFPLLYRIRNKERSLLNLAADKRVLYFATGSGHDISYLAKLDAKVLTLDFSIEMINRTKDRLRHNSIPFIFESNKTSLSQAYLDDVLDKNRVLILNNDIFDLNLPNDYFDYAFCYCTLPLLGTKWQQGLSILLGTAKHGAVSVYEVEKLADLHKYYTQFGFQSRVNDRTIYLDGGFSYYAIPPEEIMQHLERSKRFEVETIGLGKIYKWSPKWRRKGKTSSNSVYEVPLSG